MYNAQEHQTHYNCTFHGKTKTQKLITCEIVIITLRSCHANATHDSDMKTLTIAFCFIHIPLDLILLVKSNSCILLIFFGVKDLTHETFLYCFVIYYTLWSIIA